MSERDTIERMDADPPNSKLTPEARSIVSEAAGLGMPWNYCADLAGISVRTLERWRELGRAAMERGDTGDPYAVFLAEIKKRRAERVAKCLQQIHDAAELPQNWTAAMTFLERFDPSNYARRETTVLEGGDRPLIEVNIADPGTREVASKLLRALAGNGGDPAEEIGRHVLELEE